MGTTPTSAVEEEMPNMHPESFDPLDNLSSNTLENIDDIIFEALLNETGINENEMYSWLDLKCRPRKCTVYVGIILITDKFIRGFTCRSLDNI